MYKKDFILTRNYVFFSLRMLNFHSSAASLEMVEWAPQVGRGRIQFTLANHSKWTFIICTLTHSISVPNILLPTIYIFSSCSLSLSPVEILSLSNNLSTCFSSTELGMYKCCHGIESIIPWRFTIHKTKFCGRFSDE